MRGFNRLAIVLALFICAIPAAGAVSITLNASPTEAHIGDVITLNGSITGIKTIAVYLFVTGPGLDPRGVTLENFNIPAGRGLFTTSPVDMASGNWQYQWDTSITLGEMRPGKYTVYVVSSPLDKQQFEGGDYAKADIMLVPPVEPTNAIPLSSMTTVLALIAAGLIGCGVCCRVKKE
ncbi:MAG: hypothetical protein ABFC71_07115 [Methanoregula sp.]